MELPNSHCIHLHPLPDDVASWALDALLHLPSEPVNIFPCCRSGHHGVLFDREPPLCRSIGIEDEAYRFTWRHAFDGEALVRIGRQGDAIRLRWRLVRSRLLGFDSDGSPTERALPLSAWVLLQDRLADARFWDFTHEHERWNGFDGATWLIEGRRGRTFRSIERWCPRGELAALGRTFFALAGPPLSDLCIC